MPSFDELASEALSAPFSGWDLSWLNRHATPGRLPWSYRREVARLATATDAMLDMGTGGGERLSRLPTPPRTVATESWSPNVPVAGRRLRPLGIAVVHDEGAPGNMAQDGADGGRLPFRDDTFGLIANRHEAFRATEVMRVLAPGGTFITQQVDLHSYADLYRVLGRKLPGQSESWLPLARRQVQDAGLAVRAMVRGEARHAYHDVAAVVYYLRAVPFAVPDYTFEDCAAALRAAHETPELWPLVVRQRCFLLIATKP